MYRIYKSYSFRRASRVAQNEPELAICWPTIRNLRLAVQLAKKTFANKDPTIVQLLAAQNPAEITVKLKSSVYLPLIDQQLPSTTIPNPTISQRFPQTANNGPTISTA